MLRIRIAALSILAALTMSLNTYAGDGGFSSYSCLSKSGRTMLSLLMDHYTGSDMPFVVRLVIDGQMSEYKSDGMDSKNIMVEEGMLTVTEGGKEVLNLTIDDRGQKANITINKGYKDPRANTPFAVYISSNNAISVACKVFYQGP